MITTEDWELIKGALTDVSQYDDEDGIAATDLLARIESGDAQAPINPDMGRKQDDQASIVALSAFPPPKPADWVVSWNSILHKWLVRHNYYGTVSYRNLGDALFFAGRLVRIGHYQTTKKETTS